MNPASLDAKQHAHFSEHGWVLLPGVLDERQRADLIEVLDRLERTRVGLGLFPMPPDTVQLDNMPLLDAAFVEWLGTPGLLAWNRQLMESDLRLQGMTAHIKRPHKDRAGPNAAGLRDPARFAWHRGLRPRWGITKSERQPGAICSSFLNNITYLTSVSPGDGGTAILDGSHVLEGDYASLSKQCKFVEVSAPAGSVLIFSETLIHSGCPIVSERTRYNFYTEFVQPWCASHPGYEVPDSLRRMIASPEVRAALESPGWRGQDAPAHG